MPRTGYLIAIALAALSAVLVSWPAEADHVTGHPEAESPYWTCEASVARVTLLDGDPIPPVDPLGANLEKEECAEDQGGLPDLALPPPPASPLLTTTTAQSRTQIFCAANDGALLDVDDLPEDNPATPVNETEVCDAGVPAYRQHVVSTADVTDTTIHLGSGAQALTIRLQVANSYAQGRCGPGNVPVLSSDSQVLGLSIGVGPTQTPFPAPIITGDPNQVIDVLGIIKITLNELIVAPAAGETGAPTQTTTDGVQHHTYPDDAKFGQVTRRAVHIELPGGDEPAKGSVADVVVAESIADFHDDVCPEGKIIVKKETAPDENPNTTQFDFTAAPTNPGGPALTPGSASFDLTDDESQQLEGTDPILSDNEVLPGEYTVSELTPDHPYRLTALICAENEREDSTTTLDTPTRGGTAELTVQPGETVTCTFVNTKDPLCPPPPGVALPDACKGKIVIRKETVPDESPNTTSFPFTSPGLTPASFNLPDDGQQQFLNVTPNQTYTVSEALPANSAYKLAAIFCGESKAEDTTSNVAADGMSGSATINVGFEETVICTFINAKQPAGLVCPDGSAPNAQNQCPIACPAGSTLQNGQCVGTVNCPPGSTLQNGQCVGNISCPAGTTLQNGQCVGNTTCPAGTSFQNGQCVGNTTCPPGTSLQGGQCVGATVCPAGSTPNSAGQCVDASADCPAGSARDAQGRCIVSNVQCPTGTSFDPTTRACLDIPQGGTPVPINRILGLVRGSPCVGGGFGPLIAILGTNGPDRITGTNRSDRIFALGGNDRVSGGRGDDCIEGGSGRDVLDGSNGNDFLLGGTGNDRVSGGPGRDRFSGGSGRDVMSGDTGNDTMRGAGGKDRLNGGYGNDRIFGGSGNDGLSSGNGIDRLFGGSGNDIINVAIRGTPAFVDCGPGRDRVRVNKNERNRTRNCEFVDITRRIRNR